MFPLPRFCIIAFSTSALLIAGVVAGEQTDRDASDDVSKRPRVASKTERLFQSLGPAAPAVVEPFEYRLSIKSHTRWAGHDEISVPGSSVLLFGESTRRVAGDARRTIVRLQTRTGPGLIDLAAVESATIDPRPEYPADAPETFFQTEIRSLCIPPDRPALLRIRFADEMHMFAIEYKKDKGLTLRVDGKHENAVAAAEIPEFTQVQIKDDDRVIVCSPMSICAFKADKPLWNTDIAMSGQPDDIRLVQDAMLITTTAEHAFYVRRDTGELIFYHDAVLPGEDPLAEILRMGRDIAAGHGKFKHPTLARHIRAAAVLGDRRAAPFLIDAIKYGHGLNEKAMAVAALEKLNGNPKLWSPDDPEPGEVHLHWVGMKRVYPASAAKAEQEKWRRVFPERPDEESPDR